MIQFLLVSMIHTSRILDVEIYKTAFSIERNDILADTAHKELTKFARCRGNQESRISEDITYRKVG